MKPDRSREALAAWPEIGAGARLVPVTTGLINLTFRVESAAGEVFALQRLNPIFGAEVHLDILAVTEHLHAKGLTTPRLVPTGTGAPDHVLEEEVWRLLTWIPGVNLDRLDGPERAEAAGRLLGRFHAALADFERPFRHRRLGVHDTERHLEGLRAALADGSGHPRFADVAPLGRAILAEVAALPPLPATPPRVVHGDPKISNLVFEPSSGQGVALIDLDTIARMPLPVELADAFRSWCNLTGEDDARPQFDLELFERAVGGYLEIAGPGLSAIERGALVTATRLITLELAARFCRDALEERYFGWDPHRFATRSEHNEVRARGQLELARDLALKAGAAERIVASSPG